MPPLLKLQEIRASLFDLLVIFTMGVSLRQFRFLGAGSGRDLANLQGLWHVATFWCRQVVAPDFPALIQTIAHIQTMLPPKG